MKKILLFVLFGFLSSSYASNIDDFASIFVCKLYVKSVDSFNKSNNMEDLMLGAYKYTNSTIKLIDSYSESDFRNNETFEKINELRRYFISRRKLLDSVVGVKKDIELDSLSLLYNVYSKDDVGAALDLFSIYGLNKNKMSELGEELDKLDSKIKYIIVDLINLNPSLKNLSCN